jgi:hypothetical protein
MDRLRQFRLSRLAQFDEAVDTPIKKPNFLCAAGVPWWQQRQKLAPR